MKKLMSLLVVLMMMFSAFAMAEDADPFTGEWKLSTVQVEKMLVPAAGVGLDMSVVLAQDGAAVMTLSGSTPLTGKWLATGMSLNIVIGDETQNFIYDPVADTLSNESEGMTMVYSRVYGGYPAKKDATLNDFAGMWYCHAVESNGVQLMPSMLSMDIAVTINKTETACLVLSLQDSGNELLSWRAENGAVTDGVLTVNMQEENSAFDSLALTLDESGVLYYEMMMDGEPLGFYFTQYIYMNIEE